MSIPQEAKYRESVCKYAKKYGVKKAAVKFHEPESTIYCWLKKWRNGSYNTVSLTDKSKRPHTNPKTHTDEELKKIYYVWRRNPNLGLQDLWIRLRDKHGYTRTMPGLLKALKRLGIVTNPKIIPSPTCKKNKPYQAMWRPGERIQIDVKYVPKECLDPAYFAQFPFEGLYQYTAIDEYSRYRILGAYREHNTYASSLFLRLVYSAFKAMGIRVECVQTDNGSEFTSRLLTNDNKKKSEFERTAKRLYIKLKHIKPHTPKHNGKVERSHREDQKLFYSEIIRTGKLIKSFNDFKQRLKRHQDKTNHRPMRPLGYLSPIQYLDQYQLYKHMGNQVLKCKF